MDNKKLAVSILGVIFIGAALLYFANAMLMEKNFKNECSKLDMDRCSQSKKCDAMSYCPKFTEDKTACCPKGMLDTLLTRNAPESAKISGTCAKEGEIIDGNIYYCCGKLNPLPAEAIACDLKKVSEGPFVCGNCGDGICNSNYEGRCNCPADCGNSECGKEGENLGGKVDRCCSGLKPTPSSTDGGFGGMMRCEK